MTTATKTKQIAFLTDRPSSFYSIEGGAEIRNERGTVIKRLPGTVLRFDGATARVTEKENRDGELRAYCNGVEQGWDFDAMIAAIKDHSKFNVRFWVEDKGPHDAQPTVKEMTELIAEADAERLRELHEQERSTHNRRAVLELVAKRALDIGAGENGDDPGGGTDNVR